MRAGRHGSSGFGGVVGGSRVKTGRPRRLLQDREKGRVVGRKAGIGRHACKWEKIKERQFVGGNRRWQVKCKSH